MEEKRIKNNLNFFEKKAITFFNDLKGSMECYPERYLGEMAAGMIYCNPINAIFVLIGLCFLQKKSYQGDIDED